MDLRLTVKRPGSLLSKMLDTDISDYQYAQIVLICSDPDRWVLTERQPQPQIVMLQQPQQQPQEEATEPEVRRTIGFQHKGGSNAGS